MKKNILFSIFGIFVFSTISAQYSGPENMSVCKNDSTLFIVTHSADYTTFTWEESTDNMNFIVISQGDNNYQGIDDDTLHVFTEGFNTTSSGIWRYYRCILVSEITGEATSDTASLTINLNPVVDYYWENPCQYQAVNFFGEIVSSDTEIQKWEWTFDDIGESVYQSPSFVFTYSGEYNVNLTATDENGCNSSASHYVSIYNIPEIGITGKPTLCSNELNVEYSAVHESGSASNVEYQWDIFDFGEIENNTEKTITVDWKGVTIPTHTDILVRVTFYFEDTLTCMENSRKNILLTTYKAPPAGEVFRKPYESSLLIYKGPEVGSYQWGFTDSLDQDYLIPSDQGGNRMYCDFGNTFDTTKNAYWVETSYDSRINCVTRSFQPSPPTDKNIVQDNNSTNELLLFPVPAVNHITIQLKNSKIEKIIIYNSFSQMVMTINGIGTSEKTNINISGLSNGIYIAEIIDEYEIIHHKVFVIKK